MIFNYEARKALTAPRRLPPPALVSLVIHNSQRLQEIIVYHHLHTVISIFNFLLSAPPRLCDSKLLLMEHVVERDFFFVSLQMTHVCCNIDEHNCSHILIGHIKSDTMHGSWQREPTRPAGTLLCLSTFLPLSLPD